MIGNAIGSKFKMNIHIDGLGNEKYATDAGVTIKATFYTRHPENTSYTPYVVNKTAMTADDTQSNDFSFLVDTTGLGYGKLYALIEVGYSDSVVGSLVEKNVYETDIILVKGA